jgi:hypothetical protein
MRTRGPRCGLMLRKERRSFRPSRCRVCVLRPDHVVGFTSLTSDEASQFFRVYGNDPAIAILILGSRPPDHMPAM